MAVLDLLIWLYGGGTAAYIQLQFLFPGRLKMLWRGKIRIVG